MAIARDLEGGDNHVVAVIGDSSMSAGMAYEALNNAGALDSRLIVILNDNDMSIAPPTGPCRPISRARFGRRLSFDPRRRQATGQSSAALLLRQGAQGRGVFAQLHHWRHDVRGTGLLLRRADRRAQSRPSSARADDSCATGDGPVLVHVITQKGKGYGPAEASDDKYHGVNKFDVATGQQIKPKANAPSYTQHFRQEPRRRGRARRKIVAITAGHAGGTGSTSSQRFPAAPPSTSPSPSSMPSLSRRVRRRGL